MLFQLIHIYFSNFLLYYYDKNDYYYKILNELSSLNIIFIKIFQWLFCEDFLKDELLIKNLEIFTNNCKYNKNDIDFDLINFIKVEYNNKNINLNIDLIPINSGSINLIFKCEMNNNQVILKINRKNIKKKLDDSINFFNFLNIFKFLDKYNILNIIQKNQDFLLNQIDLQYEIENQKLFIEKYSKYEYVKIPLIYNLDEIKGNYILMEYINGYNLHNIPNNEKNIFSENFNKFILSFLNTHIIHGDLHFGNILFKKENNINKIVLIDFGIILQLNINQVNWLYKSLKSNSKKELIKYLIHIEKLYDNINHSIINKIEEYYMNNYYIFLDENDDKNVIITPRDGYNIISSFNKFNIEFPKFISTFIVSIYLYGSISFKLNDEVLSKTLTNNFKKMSNKFNL